MAARQIKMGLLGYEMNSVTIHFYSGMALFIIFTCATFMVLCKRVKDGVLLKFSLVCLASTSALAALTRLRGVEFMELDMAVFLLVAFVASVMLLMVYNNTSKFLEH